MGQVAAKTDGEKRGHDRPGTESEPRLAGRAAEWAPAHERWHTAAVRWYESLAVSGQSAYYQQSDADQAYVLAEALSYGLKRHEASWVRIWLTGSRELLSTESARRGAHVRLDPSATNNAVLEAQHDETMNVIRGNFGETVA